MADLVPESEQQYGSILTVLGESAEQNGKMLKKPVEFTHIAFGDANDTYVQPDRKAQSLVNELYRIPVNSVDVLQPTPDSVPILKVEALIPDDIHDIVIREFAAVATFNGQSYFHAVGNCARVYVPNPVNNGQLNNPVSLEMTFVITSAEPIVEMDPNVITASRNYVNTQVSKSDERVAQAIIDQNGKDWFIDDGFLVTPQASAFNIKAGAGYVSGNRVMLEFDRNVQVPNKPSFIYVDAHREGTPTGEQVTLFDFVITADEKDDYTDANGMKHFVCKIAQVLGDGTVTDLRSLNVNASKEYVNANLLHLFSLIDGGKYSAIIGETINKDKEGNAYLFENDEWYVPNAKLLPFTVGESPIGDVKWINLNHRLTLSVEEQAVDVRIYGFKGTGLASDAQNDIDAINAALDANAFVKFSDGIYPIYELTHVNKTIVTSRNAIFTVPNNSITDEITEPVSAFVVRGKGNTIIGELTANGNNGTNFSSNINTSNRQGLIHIAAEDFTFEKIRSIDAFWVGYSEGSINDAANNINGDLVTIINPVSYAVSAWNSSDGSPLKINVLAGSKSLDARVRTGSQESSPNILCLNRVFNIVSNDTVVAEANTTNCIFSTVTAKAFKFECAINSRLGVGVFSGVDSDAYSFSMLRAKGCNFENVSVLEHNGSTDGACFFSDVESSNNGVLVVRKSQKGTADVTIRSHKDLTFDHISMPDGNLSERGLFVDYDADYAPQEGLCINSVTSTGHAISDVEVQSPQIINPRIGFINKDAKTNLPVLKYKGLYDESTIVVAASPDSGIVNLSNNVLSWVQNGREISVHGRLKVGSVSNASGDLIIGNLPFACADYPSVGGMSQFTVLVLNTTPYSGVIYGTIDEGSNTIRINGYDGSTPFDVSNILRENTTIGFDFSYIAEILT
ncbi:phage tail protein [Vibrio vulnificus]|uniref:phage tail-collar fiber domain-containing protein n=1 Tax=Vibrio vulnificus TaxID=672 RepID=UPI001FAF710A|nr:phage tail protein [Vibrio vulnificus]MCJ0817966.1 phage tail protein [Vibrio vulnificus]